MYKPAIIFMFGFIANLQKWISFCFLVWDLMLGAMEFRLKYPTSMRVNLILIPKSHKLLWLYLLATEFNDHSVDSTSHLRWAEIQHYSKNGDENISIYKAIVIEAVIPCQEHLSEAWIVWWKHGNELKLSLLNYSVV